jgi:hypothetical protein
MVTMPVQGAGMGAVRGQGLYGRTAAMVATGAGSFANIDDIREFECFPFADHPGC